MARVAFTQRYFDSIAQITSPRLQNRLTRLVTLIADVPTSGSRLNRKSLKAEFGEDCYTADLMPFNLVYEYRESEDLVLFHGIVHQRNIL